MRILAIDPGNEKSAAVVYDTDGGHILAATIEDNQDMLFTIDAWRNATNGPYELAVEMIASYGMPVGKEVFETCVWIGRFIERWGKRHTKVYRKDVKMHLCRSMRAKDSNIRQALMDRFGPGKAKAVGTKKAPGALYGIRGDMWAALAVALTFADTMGDG